MTTEEKKIFVGGINHSTTKESLKSYFTQFGPVSDSVIIQDNGHVSRGFGFVTFEDASSVERVLQEPLHRLDDKKIDPKRAYSKATPKTDECANKIFIGGLANGTTEDTVKKHLEQHKGVKVVKVDLKYDKEDKKRMRGFGFVELDSEDAVDELCSKTEKTFIELDNKKVEVKRAEPRRNSSQGNAKGQHQGFGRGGSGLYGDMQGHFYPQSYPNYGGYPSSYNYHLYSNPGGYSQPPHQGVGYQNQYTFMQGQGYGYGSGFDNSVGEQRGESYGVQRGGYQQYGGQQQMTGGYNQDVPSPYSQGTRGGYSGGNSEGGFGQNSYTYSSSDMNSSSAYTGGYHSGGDKQNSSAFGGGSRGGQQSRGPAQYGAAGGFGSAH